MTLARVDNAPSKKTGEISLDLAEMRPVNVVTLLLCHLKRPLRYGGYLCSALELSDTIYQKQPLRCDHSVTISQRSGRFRNGIVYIFCVMYSLMIHFGIK